jgi:hypothetical protein
LPKFSVFLVPVPAEAVPHDEVMEKRRAKRKAEVTAFARTPGMSRKIFGFQRMEVSPFAIHYFVRSTYNRIESMKRLQPVWVAAGDRIR